MKYISTHKSFPVSIPVFAIQLLLCGVCLRVSGCAPMYPLGSSCDRRISIHKII